MFELLPMVVLMVSPCCVLLQVPKAQPVALITSPEDSQHYEEARQCVEELALYLKPLSNTRGITTQIQLHAGYQHSVFFLLVMIHCCLPISTLEVVFNMVTQQVPSSLGVQLVSDVKTLLPGDC